MSAKQVRKLQALKDSKNGNEDIASDSSEPSKESKDPWLHMAVGVPWCSSSPFLLKPQLVFSAGCCLVLLWFQACGFGALIGSDTDSEPAAGTPKKESATVETATESTATSGVKGKKKKFLDRMAHSEMYSSHYSVMLFNDICDEIGRSSCAMPFPQYSMSGSIIRWSSADGLL